MSSSVSTPTPVPSPQGGGEERAAGACLTQAFRSAAAAFAETAEQVLAGGAVAHVDSGDIERVLTAAMKLYAAKAEAEGVAAPPPPVSAETLTPTEAVVVISETMRAVNLNLFDLSMWYRRAR